MTNDTLDDEHLSVDDLGGAATEPPPPAQLPHDVDGLYACLRVPPDATPEQVQQAYYQACQVYHPDKLYNASPEQWKVATDHMQKINMAYFILSDRARRLAYTKFGSEGAELMQLIPEDVPAVCSRLVVLVCPGLVLVGRW